MLKKWYAKLVIMFWSVIYGELTKEEKERIYDGLHSVYDLADYLRVNRFKWGSDGLNLNIRLDTFERPERLLARGFGNCGDFMRLYEDFLKFKGVGRYTQYELRDGYDWHYVSVIDGDTFQTNMRLLPMQGDEGATLLYYFPEYEEVHVIDEWEGK